MSTRTKVNKAAADPEPLTDDQCLICSPWLKGYALKSKQWVSILVQEVREIEWNEDAFEYLVLPNGYKDLVKGLVMAQLRNPSPEKREKRFDDFIDGKGRGMVMLLSGPQGWARR
ncbi:hypothetical protein PG997_014764 [Apiospora hydei]|uniref:Uncharacterized protein n=1 Tax=Apiospora hydei TaxID=1337664 RepID=A0ABR1UUU6_9PEZI